METWEPKLVFHNAVATPPPFNVDIVAVISSRLDTGSGFGDHFDVISLRILCEGADGSYPEGVAMMKELTAGEASWEDLQFRVVSTNPTDDDLYYYSDSIVWWAEMPQQIPTPESV